MTTKPEVPPYDPEDDTLPRWDDIKHGYSKRYVDQHEKWIVEKRKMLAEARRARHHE
jgi:hypothetical protein